MGSDRKGKGLKVESEMKASATYILVLGGHYVTCWLRPRFGRGCCGVGVLPKSAWLRVETVEMGSISDYFNSQPLSWLCEYILIQTSTTSLRVFAA
jgi:hypothetical protein